MSSPYLLPPRQKNVSFHYLPLEHTLKDGRCVLLDVYKESTDEKQVFALLNYAVEEGNSYPQMKQVEMDEFRAFWTSYDVFVCRDRGESSGRDVVGSFYVKPNFPGRSSHICDAGFLVRQDDRNVGIGRFLTEAFLHIAKDLGYEASFFNLVYSTNTGAIKIYKDLGFQEIGIIPRAGRLKGQGMLMLYVDAIQFYYDLRTVKGPLT